MAGSPPNLVVDFLDNLAVGAGLELAHIVPVENVDRRIFAATDRFVRELARLVRHQQHTSRAQILVNFR